MMIDTNGKVGIGTVTPTQLLDVAGNGNFSGSVTAASFSGSGASLTSVSATNSTQLGGVAAANYARLDIGNSFNAAQTISAASGAALQSTVSATSGSTFGVVGDATANSAGGAGVEGRGGMFGVRGTTANTANDAAGVHGESTAASGITFGVRGTAASPQGNAVRGDHQVLTNNTAISAGSGVFGTYGFNADFTVNSAATGGTGVTGRNAAAGPGTQGVATTSTPEIGRAHV